MIICGYPEDLEWGESITVCCNDIAADSIMVALKVIDKSGNESVCMVIVRVQDKLPPKDFLLAKHHRGLYL